MNGMRPTEEWLPDWEGYLRLGATLANCLKTTAKVRGHIIMIHQNIRKKTGGIESNLFGSAELMQTKQEQRNCLKRRVYCQKTSEK